MSAGKLPRFERSGGEGAPVTEDREAGSATAGVAVDCQK